MKKLLGSFAAMALMTVPTMAADMPLKAPPREAIRSMDFSGWYVGASVGYSHSRARTSQRLTPGEPCADGGGGGTGCALQQEAVDSISPALRRGNITGGLQAGHNWRFGQFVVGIEADINYLDVDRTELTQASWVPNISGSTRTIATTSSLTSDYVATLRPRLGVVGLHNILFYATGGFALTNLKYSNSSVITNFGGGGAAQGVLATYNASSSVKFGYVVGGGLEYAWSRNRTFKIEYQHLRFDIPAVTGFNPVLSGGSLDASALTSRARVSVDAVRVGLNFGFEAR